MIGTLYNAYNFQHPLSATWTKNTSLSPTPQFFPAEGCCDKGKHTGTIQCALEIMREDGSDDKAFHKLEMRIWQSAWVPRKMKREQLHNLTFSIKQLWNWANSTNLWNCFLLTTSVTSLGSVRSLMSLMTWWIPRKILRIPDLTKRWWVRRCSRTWHNYLNGFPHCVKKMGMSANRDCGATVAQYVNWVQHDVHWLDVQCLAIQNLYLPLMLQHWAVNGFLTPNLNDTTFPTIYQSKGRQQTA